MEDSSDIQLKKDIIRAEIINKNYNIDKFFEFCIQIKENGDNLENWSLLELNEVITSFIQEQKGAKLPSESNEVQKEEIDQLTGYEKPKEESIQHEFEINCKKLEPTPINNREVKVLLKNPKRNERTFFETSYVTYEVVTEAMEWCVRRRFSDFEWLRTILVKCYSRLMVPPLPGKKIGNRRFEDDFIQRRMEFLQKFLDNVMKIEEFKTSEALIAFLSMIDRGQFDAKMREMTSFIPSPYVEDIKTLTGRLTVFYDEENEKYYTNLAKYFNLQNQLFERLNYNLKNYHTHISEAIIHLAEVQKDFETLNLLNRKIYMKEEITKTFEELGVFFRNWKRIQYNQNELIKKQIKDFFKYMRMEGESYVELIKNREVIYAKYKEESTRLKQKKERLWQVRDISKWEIVDQFNKVDNTLLFTDRNYAFEKMCTKETNALESIRKQLGYTNKMNLEELNKLILLNSERYVATVKEFAEKFYPSLTDGITLWSTLNGYI